MITAHLSSGLGNQLFQYAAGLSLARRRNTSLLLDTRAFRGGARSEDPNARPMRILDFDLPFTQICTPEQEQHWRIRWNVATNLHLPARWFGFHAEKNFRFDPAFHDQPDGTCLRGYFQSEEYFRPFAADVRTAFRPKDAALVARIDAQLDTFRTPGRPLVALHIRRGDFLTLTDRDCLTSDEFQDAAMAKFPGAAFLVFSDDLPWCRERFKGRDDVAFSPFTRVIEDFFAMARCDHNILAKSTFSWWAAWLNSRPDRRVIAPVIALDKKPVWGGGSPEYYPRGWTIF